MFHIELIIKTIRQNAGFYRISDKLYTDIIKAGLFKSFTDVSPGVYKIECIEDDVYVELKNYNAEYYFDVLTTQ